MQVIPSQDSKSSKASKHGNYEKLELHPQLEELLKAMWLKCPAFIFEKAGCDGLEKVTKCYVIFGYEKLGCVEVANTYTRNGYVMMWRIYSSRIRNSRGDRHVKKSKNLKSALNVALDVFQPTDKKELALKILKVASAHVNSVMNNACRPFERLMESHSFISFNYCLDYWTNNKDERPSLPKALTDLFESKAFKDMADNRRIATSVFNEMSKFKTGVVIRVERDDTINVVDVESQTLLSLKSTYDLPKNYQEKFTILKVMEHNQPIVGIGIKVSDDLELNNPLREFFTYYYLVGGETPVVN